MKTLYFYVFLFSILTFSQEKKILTIFDFENNSKKQVYLSGDFNDWNPRSHPMYLKDGKWHLALELNEGFHYFTYIDKTNIMPDPNYPLIIDRKLNKFMSVIKVGNPGNPKRMSPDVEFPSNFFPQLVYESNPSYEIVFNSAQKLLFDFFYSYFSFSSLKGSNISPLLSLCASYFNDVIPVGKYLDSFYEDEYIVYDIVENAENCAFLPYCELRYFQMTGDDSRFKLILPKLLRKYELLHKFVQNEIKKQKISFDPFKINEVKYSPVYLKSLQALYVKYVSLIAGILKEDENASLFVSKYVTLSDNINRKYLNSTTKIYFDKWEDGKTSNRFHSGQLLTILAEVCPNYSIESVKNAFSNSDYFYPVYNYFFCKGLSLYNGNSETDDLAHETVKKIIDSYNQILPITEHLNLNERFTDGYTTFWNSYSAIVNSPMIFDESQLYSKQDDLLTAGPGFYNLLIEHFLGLQFSGNENIVRWKVRGTEKQGIKNISFRDQKISLEIAKEKSQWYLDVKCSYGFELFLDINGKNYKKIIQPGYNSIILE